MEELKESCSRPPSSINMYKSLEIHLAHRSSTPHESHGTTKTQKKAQRRSALAPSRPTFSGPREGRDRLLVDLEATSPSCHLTSCLTKVNTSFSFELFEMLQIHIPRESLDVFSDVDILSMMVSQLGQFVDVLNKASKDTISHTFLS